MFKKAINKIKSNLSIYRSDIKSKGIYWSIIHRLYKIPNVKKIIIPVVNYLKPDYLVIENNKLFIDKWDEVVSQELLISGKWEEYESELFKKNIRNGDIVVDIGAHIGYYTLIAARLVGSKGKVYAFEPNSRNFQILKKNVEQNNLENVVLVNKAVSNKNSKGMLFINNENTGDNRIYDSKDNRKIQHISTVTLDHYFEKREKRVDMIKMDIQGSEGRAFEGGENLIKKNKDVKIISEFQPALMKLSGIKAPRYLRMLRKAGFKIYEIDIQKKKIKKIISDTRLLSAYPDSDTSQTNFTNLFCEK